MDEEEQSTPFVFSIILIAIGAFVMFWLLDLVIPGNKITKYSVLCLSEIKKYECTGSLTPGVKVTYKVSSSKNTVVSNVDGFVFNYENCTVFNSKSWQCTLSNDDLFGAQNGKFFDLPSHEATSIQLDSLAQIKYVSRIHYYLVWIGYDNFTDKYMPNSLIIENIR